MPRSKHDYKGAISIFTRENCGARMHRGFFEPQRATLAPKRAQEPAKVDFFPGLGSILAPSSVSQSLFSILLFTAQPAQAQHKKRQFKHQLFRGIQKKFTNLEEKKNTKRGRRNGGVATKIIKSIYIYIYMCVCAYVKNMYHGHEICI